MYITLTWGIGASSTEKLMTAYQSFQYKILMAGTESSSFNPIWTGGDKMPPPPPEGGTKCLLKVFDEYLKNGLTDLHQTL